MAGAIIPDDWDGSTFECNKIQWPASPKWQAILLGQITEPAWANYWDPDTGDVEEAQEGVEDAFDLTIPDIYSEDCNVIPGIPVAAFWANKTANQAITAGTWTTVTWDTMGYDLNNPNFSLALEAHNPINADLMGLWHYDVNLKLLTATLMVARAIQTPGNVVKAWARMANNGTISLSFDEPHIVGGDQLRIEIWSSIANTVMGHIPDTRYNGHFLGPVSE